MSITRARVQRAALPALAAAFLFLTGATTHFAFAQVAFEQTPPGQGSLGVFRLEVKIPFGAAESFPRYEIPLAIESEIVPDVESRQTFPPLPPAHLRRVRRDGTTEPRPVLVSLRPELPYELLQSMPEHRFQAASNRFVSDWIVVIGDPRASKDYVWPAGTTAQQKEAAGCHSCERPPHLRGPNAQRFHEIYSAGRWLSVRLETGIFAGTPYAYLGEERRLEIREPTILSDTVRPTNVLVAAQHPPVATGMLQETTYLHSGEVETSNIDLDAGGRNGWNVVIDRTYRSRTIGATPFGMGGWTSSMFRRLRALPDGSIDYRDAAGENWNFTVDSNTHTYVSPKGLFLKLTRSDRGWTMIDQKWRITTFDELGRLTSESDEFYSPTVPDSGNVIRYIYAPDGMLYRVLDPVGRATTLLYDSTSGFVKEVADWRGRRVSYEYDPQGRLAAAKLPEVGTFTGTNRPTIKYSYEPSAGGSFNDQLELATNLKSITEPHEAATGGNPRVTFSYGAADARDKVSGQRWATGETVIFAYSGPSEVSVTDALGQQRQYTLITPPNDRAHVATMREIGVPVLAMAPFGQLPASLPPGAPAVTAADREWSFTYANGVRTTSKLAGVQETTNAYQSVGSAPGVALTSSKTVPVAGAIPQPFMPTPIPIERTFRYQATTGIFLNSMEASGKIISSPQPHRYAATTTATNSSVNAQTEFDTVGLLKNTTSTGGTDSASAGSKSSVEYYPATDSLLWRRSMPRLATSGDPSDPNALKTTTEYPSATERRTIDSRRIITTTTLDSWDRPVRVVTVGPDVTTDESYLYDANGRLENEVTKKGSELVTTTYTYDAMGRRASATTDKIATASGVMTTKTQYDLATRKIIATYPGGAVTTTELDSLGRVKRTFTHTGSSPIEYQFAYDIDGNQVFVTNMFTASATAFDAHGRAVATKYSDGTISLSERDAWGRATRTRTLDDTGTNIVSETSLDLTDAGQLKNVAKKVDAGVTRQADFAWDGAGRTTSSAINGRASKSGYDLAGRKVTHAAGEGSTASLSDVFEKTDITAHSGDLPVAAQISEKNSPPVATTLDRGTSGEPTRETVGNLEWKKKFDELGSLTEASAPGRSPSRFDVDARGAVRVETLPDGAQQSFAYSHGGAPSGYTDPTNEAVSTQMDLADRPVKRTYADGTTELVEWEGTRLKSVTDRQGRKQIFIYNAKGQHTETRDGSALLDKLSYDSAGRLTSWLNKDSEIVWSDFDLDGNAKKTTQRRFKDGSGLSSSPVVLDAYAQEHRWNEHGERTHWSMPASAGVTFGAGWTKWVREQRDAMKNLVMIGKVDDPSATSAIALMTGSYHNAGRPEVRTVFAGAGPLAPAVRIVRTYGYHTQTGLRNKLTVTAKGIVVAGAEVAYEGLLKSDARLLGVSGGQSYAKWRYDARGRLASSLFGATDPGGDPNVPVPGRAKEHLTPADFRTAQERVAQLSGAAAAATGASRVDPPSKTISEKSGGGHKIEKVTRGPKVYPFGYSGAEVVDDGRFTYEFDAKGRLVRAIEKVAGAPKRRIVYSYSGTNRLVGRRAEYATVENSTPTDWKLEDRSQILNDDGLPAETTYVWDLMSDRLVTIARAGAQPGDPHGGLLKQIIHGGASYDDPIETATIDPFAPNTVNYLYPVYDEAGAGSIQVVLNKKGEVVARNLPLDPFGGENVEMMGAAVDRVAIKAKKTSTGAIDSIEITLRATEQLAPASIPSGARLSAVDSSGAVIRLSVAPAILQENDANAIRWTLTPGDWASLTTGAAAISIAATSSLRAAAWGANVPVLPAPEWARASKPIYSSADLPVEARESLSSLSSFLAGIPNGDERTTKLYEVENLALASVGGSDAVFEDVLAARLHAHPFTEPLTGLDYVRFRWYQPLSGTWLSPDPKGPVDSANLFSFAGSDPVNARDPRGTDRSEISDDRRALRAKKDAELRGQQERELAEYMKHQDQLQRLGNAQMQKLRKLGINVRAEDVVFRLPDGIHGVTASGRIVVDPSSGAIHDQTAELVLTASGFRVAATAIKAAYRTGGAGAAALVAADEAVGQLLGVNPSPPPAIVSGLRKLSRKEVHDIGVGEGMKQADSDELTRIDWDNPFRHYGEFGQGFDDIYRAADGSLVIVEYKGGTARLMKGQMGEEWVQKNIDRLLLHGDEMGMKLLDALSNQRLSGITYSTKVVNGAAKQTRVIKVSFYGQ